MKATSRYINLMTGLTAATMRLGDAFILQAARMGKEVKRVFSPHQKRGGFKRSTSKSYPPKEHTNKCMINGRRVCLKCAGHWDRIRNADAITEGKFMQQVLGKNVLKPEYWL